MAFAPGSGRITRHVLSRLKAGLPLIGNIRMINHRPNHNTEQLQRDFSENRLGIKEITKNNSEEFLSHYDSIFLDCDGVLWRTDHVTPIPGIPAVMRKLRDLGKQILFVTNNSILSRDQWYQKYLKYDFDPGKMENIFCVAYATAVYLRDVLKITGYVYNVGSVGMERELTLAGIKNIGTGEDPEKPSPYVKDLLNMTFRNDVQAVVIGFDEFFNYTKLYKAASYLTDPACHFVSASSIGFGTGVMIGPNRLQPFTGPIVSAVKTVSKREPILIGKPGYHMFECIKATHPRIDTSRCLMIGDSITADVGFAKSTGMDSAFVLSGSGTFDHVKQNPHLVPDFYMDSLVELNYDS
ncbi:glycerol-3-phosphate phosphatase [Patella vulgata]|uniref:glycerol-3-phosphate phosphatase n=1 Tax=Patella vulgata TaxID=6465 RepID=UPI0024A824A2|nr:glycerol-3-phosphate phosphatase [Patella vulgata]